MSKLLINEPALPTVRHVREPAAIKPAAELSETREPHSTCALSDVGNKSTGVVLEHVRRPGAIDRQIDDVRECGGHDDGSATSGRNAKDLRCAHGERKPGELADVVVAVRTDGHARGNSLHRNRTHAERPGTVRFGNTASVEMVRFALMQGEDWVW